MLLRSLAAGGMGEIFLAEHTGVELAVHTETRWHRLVQRTGEHLVLVAVSLGAAILLAVPLGVLAARRPRLGQVLLAIEIARVDP